MTYLKDLARRVSELQGPDRHMTTGELATRLGVTPATLRKWKKRGDLKLAPRGRSGQGRGNECLWTPEACLEAMRRRDERRTSGHRTAALIARREA